MPPGRLACGVPVGDDPVAGTLPLTVAPSVTVVGAVEAEGAAPVVGAPVVAGAPVAGAVPVPVPCPGVVAGTPLVVVPGVPVDGVPDGTADVGAGGGTVGAVWVEATRLPTAGRVGTDRSM